MYYKCCVCNVLRKDAINLTLFRFPKSERRRLIWLKSMSGCGISLPTELRGKFICERHFEKRFVLPKNRLTSKAYPSLFSPSEMSHGIPAKENAENIDPCEDHAYVYKGCNDHSYCKQARYKDIDVVPQEKPSFHVEQVTPGLLIGRLQDSISETLVMAEPEPTASTSGFMKYLRPEHIPSESLPQQVLEVTGSLAQVSATDKDKPAIKTKKPRKRLVPKLSELSPESRVIYAEYKKSKRQADFHKRAQRALKFNKERAFQKLTENINPYAKKILEMQINLYKKPKKARRFTLEEKLIALSIMKQSPKCYRFLHKIFILPSRATLNRMVAGLKIESGICPQVFDLMKREIGGWNEKKKMCSVMFDEMSLQPGITYNKNKDKITGLVELIDRKNEFADHALVFMLRGAVYKWQQPIAFYFCQGATKAPEVKNIIGDIITAVVGCGLKPVALICDQGSAFQSAINSLKAETARDQILTHQRPDDTITINGTSLLCIFDPPHLIKGLRNNFLTKNIIMDGKISKWRDIVDVYETDCNHTEVRLLHKLNDQHVIPEKIKKMKVKHCVRIFSKTVSAALSYTAKFSHYADGRPVSETIKNTAETVLFFDQLFDSVNGASKYPKKNGKLLRTAVTETSPHHEFWVDSIKKLRKIKYVHRCGALKSVPSLNNFVTTLKAFMKLWQLMKNKNITIMRPRYFNSDPIENFFGQVRAYNYRNNDPDCHSFKNTFKSLLITKIIKFHNPTFNCEDDPADQIIDIQHLFEHENENIEPGHPSEHILQQARRERLNVHSRAYTAGWVVTKTLSRFNNCANCKKYLTTETGSIHQWTSQREYDRAKEKLTYPSEGTVRAFGTITAQTKQFLEENANQNHISRTIQERITASNDFTFFKCAQHKEALIYFMCVVIKFTITNWCHSINKILNGTDIKRLRNRILPAMQQKAYNKYLKRLKNKKFNK